MQVVDGPITALSSSLRDSSLTHDSHKSDHDAWMSQFVDFSPRNSQGSHVRGDEDIFFSIHDLLTTNSSSPNSSDASQACSKGSQSTNPSDQVSPVTDGSIEELHLSWWTTQLANWFDHLRLPFRPYRVLDSCVPELRLVEKSAIAMDDMIQENCNKLVVLGLAPSLSCHSMLDDGTPVIPVDLAFAPRRRAVALLLVLQSFNLAQERLKQTPFKWSSKSFSESVLLDMSWIVREIEKSVSETYNNGVDMQQILKALKLVCEGLGWYGLFRTSSDGFLIINSIFHKLTILVDPSSLTCERYSKPPAGWHTYEETTKDCWWCKAHVVPEDSGVVEDG